MAAQIQTALMHLGQALGRLDNAVKLREREREKKAAAGGGEDLFSAASRAGEALDTARMSRTLDRAIATIEAILKEG